MQPFQTDAEDIKFYFISGTMAQCEFPLLTVPWKLSYLLN